MNILVEDKELFICVVLYDIIIFCSEFFFLDFDFIDINEL